MQEQRALRELAICSNQRSQQQCISEKECEEKRAVEPSCGNLLTSQADKINNNRKQAVEIKKPRLSELLSISATEFDFKQCLPGSIHEKTFTLSILKQLPSVYDLILTIICEDQALNDTSELIFGIKQNSQYEYYDDYRIKVRSPKNIDFKIGVKTPMFYHYNVACMLVIQLEDYSPLVIPLKQTAQIPDLHCPKQLSIGHEDNRVIKLSIIQNKSKKECKIPFKLNHNMILSMGAQIIGLERETNPLVDIKPKMMTLNGKGQFALILTANISDKGKIFHYSKSSDNDNPLNQIYLPLSLVNNLLPILKQRAPQKQTHNGLSLLLKLHRKRILFSG